MASPILTPAERAALDEFASWVRARFPGRVRTLLLFGSRARDEGDQDSDVDVFVAIDDLAAPEARELAAEAGDAITHWDVLLRPLCVSTAHFEQPSWNRKDGSPPTIFRSEAFRSEAFRSEALATTR